MPASEFIAPTILRPAPCVSKEQRAFRPFNTLRDLAFASVRVAAQPAVAKDTIPPSGPVSFIHQARFANDGAINKILIGRDRLGFFNDRDPGPFIIEVANRDNRYVNGDDGDDQLEYRKVFDSTQVGFSGQINGKETLQICIPTVKARFVKLTFAEAGTAIDEVEVRAP